MHNPDTSKQSVPYGANVTKFINLRWFHWLIIILSLILTIFAWYFSQKQIDEKRAVQFEREAQQIIELIQERLQHYEDALWAGAVLIHVNGNDIDYKTWQDYVSHLQLLDKYPGINGLGVIHYVAPSQKESYLTIQRVLRPNFKIHPTHNQTVYLPISYIIPVTGNEKAVGLDIAYEQNRYTSALKARDSGLAQITGPITLVQDSGRTPGFLFYAPFYQGSPATTGARKENFVGLVYAPFIVKKLMSGVLASTNRHVAIKISDEKTVLYDELTPNNPRFDAKAKFRTSKNLNLYGRVWQFTMVSDQAFASNNQNNQPLTILFGGIIIDTLLLALFVILSRENKRAIQYAEHATVELLKKTEKLEHSNAELDKFAYAASHDLKAPLHNISNLCSWIMEDDYEKLSTESKENLQNLRSCINSMDSLINGLLAYSRVDALEENISKIDLNQCVQRIVDNLGSSENVNLTISQPIPVIYANEAIINQIFMNLISNAIRHNDKDKVQIKITCSESIDEYQFSVSDNGPGIDERFADKVFELFQSLKPKMNTENSGVGLALVKKAIEAQGGEISFTSNLGEGCTFIFNIKRRT